MPIVFFLAIMARHFKSNLVAILIIAGLLGFLAPWVYPTWLGGLGTGIAVAIFAWIVLRFGLLTCLVAICFSEIVFTAIVMLGFGESSLMASGVILLICAFVPALPLLIARRRGLPVPALVGHEVR